MINFLNGKWVQEEDMTISVLDIAVLRGFGIFDFLRSYSLKPFMLSEHIDRFMNSAKYLGIKSVYSKKDIADIVYEGIRKNKVDVTIKIVQTGGVSPDGFTPGGKVTFFVLFVKVIPYPEEMYLKGIKLITSKLMRQIPQAKSINYMGSIVEVMKAQKKGAKDILHSDGKYVYESTRSNFYIIKKGNIITPAKGILHGITKKAVFTVAKQLGIPVIEKAVRISDLAFVDESFITNSSMEIVPVVQIDNMIIAKGKVGQTTIQLMNRFKKYTEEY